MINATQNIFFTPSTHFFYPFVLFSMEPDKSSLANLVQRYFDGLSQRREAGSSLPGCKRRHRITARCRTNATTFKGKDGVVKITGEAYFEVAANQERPFNDVLRHMSGWYTKKECRVLYSAGNKKGAEFITSAASIGKKGFILE